MRKINANMTVTESKWLQQFCDLKNKTEEERVFCSSHRGIGLLGFDKDLQKEEKPSMRVGGRGRVKGGSTFFGLLAISWPEEKDFAAAGCCLLSPSMTNENAPKVRQL